MRRRATIVAVGMLLVMAVVASLSIAAGPKQYQFTGSVVEFDAKAKTVKVDKGGDIWEFSTDSLKDFKAKKGDRVTVYYQMVAKKVETK